MNIIEATKKAVDENKAIYRKSLPHIKFVPTNSKNVAFIDVPGHEKLLKNMIAGAFGFDASLVVIDANEGIMPQTREHLEILNLLHVKNIIVALTKKDLATSDVIEQRTYEITEHLKSLKNLHLVEIIPVSIYEASSIQALKKALFNLPATTLIQAMCTFEVNIPKS